MEQDVPVRAIGAHAQADAGPQEPLRSVASDIPIEAAPDWALCLVDELEQAGHEVYFVGGFVRDCLAGKAPHDIDLACSAPWEQTKACLQAAGHEVIESGVRHGTVTVLPHSDKSHEIEITTFRFDGPYSDGRHPDEVRFVRSIEEDLARRDFTINAMAWSPRHGLVDPFGGRADLEAGVIRAVGDPLTRFAEDGLRVLRALRFKSKLGFSLDGATREALDESISKLDCVSGERISKEYDGIVCGAHAVEVLREHAEVICRIVPEIEPMVGFEQRSHWHCYDVWEHCLHALDELDPTASPLVRHTTLFHDIGKPETYTVDETGRGHFYGHERAGSITARTAFRRLCWRSIDMDHACLLIRVHDNHIEPTPRGVRRMLSRLSRAYAGSDEIAEQLFAELLQIKRADTLAHAPHGIGSRLNELNSVKRAYEEVLAEKSIFRVRDLAVSGRDVLMRGVPRGPEIGKTLHNLLMKVIDGTLPNDRAALLAQLDLEAELRKPL